MTTTKYPTKSEFKKMNKSMSNSFLFLGLIVTLNANAEILQIVKNDSAKAIELINYPNPFMPTSDTIISTKNYNINIKDSIVVKIYNSSLEFITEKMIKKANEELKGSIKLNFRKLLNNNKSGIYYYRIKIGKLETENNKIIITL